MNKHTTASMDPAVDARVSAYGKRLAVGLSQAADDLPADITERLRFAREQALRKAKEARAAAPVTAEQTLRMGSTLALQGGDRPARWFKLASLTPLLLLLAGLLLIQHSQWYQQLTASAEMDAALLSDKLPPAAYGDPGFSEYLSDDEQAQDPAQPKQQE